MVGAETSSALVPSSSRDDLSPVLEGQLSSLRAVHPPPGCQEAGTRRPQLLHPRRTAPAPGHQVALPGGAPGVMRRGHCSDVRRLRAVTALQTVEGEAHSLKTHACDAVSETTVSGEEVDKNHVRFLAAASSFFFSFLHLLATPCGIPDLSSPTRVKPKPLQWEHGRLNHWVTGKFPALSFKAAGHSRSYFLWRSMTSSWPQNFLPKHCK